MKFTLLLETLLVVFLVSSLFLSCSSDTSSKNGQYTTDSTSQQVAANHNDDILFGTLYPFFKGTIQFETSKDLKTLTLNGGKPDVFGFVCMERKILLRGKRTFEIEVLDLGKSSFRSGKMLKVIIRNELQDGDSPLICQNNMALSNDPEYLLPLTGTFRYGLESTTDDSIYKLAFVFYNATLDNFKLRARFVN